MRLRRPLSRAARDVADWFRANPDAEVNAAELVLAARVPPSRVYRALRELRDRDVLAWRWESQAPPTRVYRLTR